MGRYSYSRRNMVENSLILSIKGMKEIIQDNPDKLAIAKWENGNQIGLIYKSESEEILISYQIKSNNLSVKTYISIIKQPCNYGDSRYYFACPDCWKKVYKLYKPHTDNYFACRTCHNLTYREQKKHNKSDDKYKYGRFDRQAAKLIVEGKPVL